jgi:hypothetical protein
MLDTGKFHSAMLENALNEVGKETSATWDT